VTQEGLIFNISLWQQKYEVNSYLSSGLMIIPSSCPLDPHPFPLKAFEEGRQEEFVEFCSESDLRFTPVIPVRYPNVFCEFVNVVAHFPHTLCAWVAFMMYNIYYEAG
jgi:hypothetical protein